MNHESLSYSNELRHLPSTIIHQLIGLLDIKDNWKSLAAIIPNPDHPERLLFRTTDIAILDEQRKRPTGSPANAMIQHWSTYGRRRHTIGDAIHFLEQSNLIRAAELIRSCVVVVVERQNNQQDDDDLKEFFTESSSVYRPTAPNESIISFCNDQHTTTTTTTNDSLIRFSYQNLLLATDNFTDKNLLDGGTKLGEGSFGEVFRCSTLLLNMNVRINDSKYVAVKRFKQSDRIDSSSSRDEFLAELNVMYHFRHPNLVRLYGYCDDGPNLCIVTEYMENGSLYNYLFASNKRLSFKQRLRIAINIADAIVYLHTYSSSSMANKDINIVVNRPFVHRDIKSANILLDGELCARLADLGLVRQGSNSNMETTIVTQTVKGTSVYMAPEAFRGDVSVKVDTFSFGVVSLELWTGLAAFDPNRDDSDIVTYVDEMIGDKFDRIIHHRNIDLIESVQNAYQQWYNNDDHDDDKLAEILDANCNDFDETLAKKLIILAKCCIEQRKRNRPTMIEVQKCLNQLMCV